MQVARRRLASEPLGSADAGLGPALKRVSLYTDGKGTFESRSPQPPSPSMCVRKKPTATTIMMKCEAEKRIAAGAVVGAFDEC